MRLADQLRSVRHTFATNRARAALTLLGIVIGSGSIVMLAGLLHGGREALLRTSQRASGADLIQVRRDEPPANQLKRTQRQLGRGDQDAVDLSPVLHVHTATEVFREGRATWQGRKKRVRLVATAPGAVPLYHLELAQGRFLTADDLDQRSHSCVIGDEVWHELLEDKKLAAGEEVVLAIEGQEWTVVGVLKNKPLLGGGGDGTWMWNRKVLVPETTFDAMFSPQHTVSRLFVQVGEGEDLKGRMISTERILNGLIGRRHFGVKNFKVEGEESGAKQDQLILGIIELLLLGTGLLSLFVGGINIMNIMLVTVTERTREIGIRRAIGAPPSAILVQFLLEAGFIALVGGLVGVGGGVAATAAASLGLGALVGEWKMHVEWWSIGLGLGLSLLTGITFGLFPALRAARLDPVEALRYE